MRYYNSTNDPKEKMKIFQQFRPLKLNSHIKCPLLSHIYDADFFSFSDMECCFKFSQTRKYKNNNNNWKKNPLASCAGVHKTESGASILRIENAWPPNTCVLASSFICCTKASVFLGCNLLRKCCPSKIFFEKITTLFLFG